MRGSLRAGDSIYRIGGEEILVVLPGARKADAGAIAERLRLAVRDLHPVGVKMTISIGAAISRPGGFDVDELVRRADEALYAAKANGRDTVFFGTN
jgi:diguanylate cyclase (GGDEF)-like protein